ncbi:SPOR domain-containing protein [Roseovarius sp. M141]|uniref:SPOR domain-containing protein n=1 Tax=Roseovarius sp. M141 TaxID=2583806 RepID=UPI0020CBD4E8|nr:SPOR domain-containing protein [Roseovarius sp. M141]MCQ0093233.1 SPOR domain-containing protein [Roseovarius sp. M141]
MSRHQDDRSRSSGAPDAPAHPLSRATYALGSIVSVGLVIGLGVWGYKLLVRDVSGVPVIRAAEGPMRIQPEDPGGRQALNQGLSVNDVAAVGTAGAAPDQLILAPAPLDLSDEDAAGNVPAPPDRTSALPGGDAPESVTNTQPEATPSSEDEMDMLALAEAIGASITPLEDLPDVGDVAADGTDDENVVATSLRPRARPADLRNIRGAAAVTASSQSVRDIDPETIPVGTRLAQLGAFASEEIAREEWDRLGKRFEEFLDGKDRVIQRATSGGRTFYRLRAMGFDDLADARRFCSALVSEKAECIPVVTR